MFRTCDSVHSPSFSPSFSPALTARPPRAAWPCALALAAVTLALGLQAGEDPLAGVRFTDGQSRTLASFDNQVVVVINFCGHCPTAGKFMREQAKAAHDAIEAKHLPVRLVCLTPDLDPVALVDWTKANGLAEALVGQDTRNAKKISLNNILQYRGYQRGQEVQVASDVPTFADQVERVGSRAKDAFRYPVTDLTEERSQALWWLVERDKPQAIETLLAARKNKALKDDAEKIYSVVEASLSKRQEALVAGEASMATYEGLETLLGQAKPIVLKPAAERLKELGKDAGIKNELRARTIWQQCQELIAHPNPQKQQAGRDALEALGRKFADTVYGRKAAGG